MTIDSTAPRTTPVTDHSTPEKLVNAVAKGDRQAFGLLYERLAPMLMGVVTPVLHDGAQSEKVVLDVFLEEWRTACRSHSEKDAAPLPRMAASAHRRAVDQVRSDRADLHEPEHGDSRCAAVYIPEPSAGQHISKFLQKLPDPDREVVVLAYYGAYTYLEIAEMLDLSPDIVARRIRSGLLRLRRLADSDDPHVAADAAGSGGGHNAEVT